MRPDLVLDDDDKKKRFKKIQNLSLKDNNNEQNVISLSKGYDEDDIQIVQDHLPNKCFDSNILKDKEIECNKSGDECPSTPNKLRTIKENSKLEDDVCFPLPSEHTSKSNDFIHNIGILDPETGLGLEITNEEKSNNFTLTNNQSKDDQIMKYTHKKFRKHPLETSKYLDESCLIKKITITKISNESILTTNLRAIR